MFDIGFAELLIIGVVALLVIGPERLPGAIRTASAWVNRFRRGFNEIKQEVQQELHNDGVMQDLKQLQEGGKDLRRQTESLRQDLSSKLLPDTDTVSKATQTPDSGSSASPSATPASGNTPADPNKNTGSAAPTRPDAAPQSEQAMSDETPGPDSAHRE
ncbi:MAG: Sec-independent protein translocase protein TatB [Congregibacter sp.]